VHLTVNYYKLVIIKAQNNIKFGKHLVTLIPEFTNQLHHLYKIIGVQNTRTVKMINFITTQRKVASRYCTVLSASEATKCTIQIRAGCVVWYSMNNLSNQ